MLWMATAGYAQNKSIDSLRTLLATAKDDTNKVNILNGLGKNLVKYSAYPEVYTLEQTAAALSEKLHYDKGIAHANYYLARCYISRGKYDSALQCYDRALKLYESLGMKESKAHTLDYIGVVYFKQGDLVTAIQYSSDALALEQKVNDKQGMVSTYSNIGNAYWGMGDNVNAMKSYYAAITICEDLKDKNGEGTAYSNIGLVYYNMDSFDAALQYYNIALKLKEVSGERAGMANLLQSIGNVYDQKGDDSEALKYYVQSLNIRNDIQDKLGIGHALTNIGEANYKLGNDSIALRYFSNALEIKKAVSDKTNLPTCYFGIAKVFLRKGKTQLSHNYIDTALAMSMANHNKKQLVTAFEIRSLIDSAEGNGMAALADYKTMMCYRDSLADEDSRKKIVFLKQQVDANKQKLSDITEHKDQQQLLYKFIIGFLVVVIVVVGTLGRLNKELRSMATQKNDTPDIILRKMSLVFLSIATSLAAVVWAFLYYYYVGWRLPVLGPVLYFFFVPPSIAYFFISKKENILVNVQLFCIFTMPVMMEWTSGGFQSGVVILWSVLAPIGALIFKGVKTAAILMLLFVGAVIATILFKDHFDQFYYKIPDSGESLFYGMNILGPCIVIFFTMQFFVKTVIRDGKLLQDTNLKLSGILDELQTEKQKSDNLLLNILPAQIAEELKQDDRSAARLYNNVTVILTDFKNFTSYSEHHTPHEIVNELHECFRAFDEIMTKYDIEKIKTIGDGYLAVCGLPEEEASHALKVVGAAKEIIRFMDNRYSILGEKTFQIRIGIHSGQVVAGIVGIKKFAYDIWGDTVNIAARMEQNSEPGKINISGTTYELVKNSYSCAYRGKIPAKNKGEIDMYFVD